MRMIQGGRETSPLVRLWWTYQRPDGTVFCLPYVHGGQIDAAEGGGSLVRGPYMAAGRKDARAIGNRKLGELKAKRAHAKLMAAPPQKLLTHDAHVP